jgi:hypothetical protein
VAPSKEDTLWIFLVMPTRATRLEFKTVPNMMTVRPPSQKTVANMMTVWPPLRNEDLD